MKTVVTTFLRMLLVCWFLCIAWIILAPFVFAFHTGPSDNLIIWSLIISAILLAITVCYDNAIEYFEEKYGPLSWKTKKHTLKLVCMPPNILIYVIGSILFSLMLQSACNHNNNARTYENEIVMYRDYYLATETLLDSLGVDCDNPIMESDAGARYLEMKSVIDNY